MKFGDGTAEIDQLGDLGIEVAEAFGEEVADVSAGWRAAVTDAEDLLDLGQRQSRVPRPVPGE